MTPRLSGGKIGKNSIDNITDIERGKLPLFFGGWIGKKCIDNITDIEGGGATPFLWGLDREKMY